MFTIEYDFFNLYHLKEKYKAVAQKYFYGTVMYFNDDKIKGTLREVTLGDGLVLQMADFKLLTEHVLKGMPHKKDHYAIHFVYVKNNTGFNFTFNGISSNIVFPEIQAAIMTSDEDNISFTGNSNLQYEAMNIIVHRSWLQNNIPELFETNNLLDRYFGMKEKRIWINMTDNNLTQQIKIAFEIQDGPFYKPLMEKLAGFIISSFFMNMEIKLQMQRV